MASNPNRQESGLQWYVGDSPHLGVKYLLDSEQARLVKTVKVHCEDSQVLHGSDRRLLVGVTLQSDRYRLRHRSVDSNNIVSWLNVQSGYRKPISIFGERYPCDQGE
jgi:hypothetical protein